jgi:hypothetical protein
MAESGSVVWPSTAEPLWAFQWFLADSPDEEGVVIRQAEFRGRKVLHKASLPSLRVQYVQSCGPFKDPLNFNNSRPTTRCPNSRVCVYSYVSNGVRGLGVESYHRISAYRLTHRWVFWEHGWISARMFSAGLYCNYDHRHHAYFRLDFDIEGSGNDLALEYNNYTGNVGWGPGWEPIVSERSRVKNPRSNRHWAVLDKSSGRGYQLIPGSDGTADAFSNRDLRVLRYHGAEDRNGRQGSASSDGLDAYLNNEDVNGQDLVIWYTAHLFHQAAHGGDDWHGVGPDFAPFGNW